ncbi:hypothetical protein [Leucobacter japonicus]|uniref:hypothetical protein n=1 Tax=Leucobacter japonicus TaxID=1461259 RepID=UPI0006A7D035|nr:hypothetical protein [Leucobacter japonicus]
MNKITRIGATGVLAAALAGGIALPANAVAPAPSTTTAGISAVDSTTGAPTIQVDAVQPDTQRVQLSGTAAARTTVYVERAAAGRYVRVATVQSNAQGAWTATATGTYGDNTFRARTVGAPTNDARSYTGVTIDRAQSTVQFTAQATSVDRAAKRAVISGTATPGTQVNLIYGLSGVTATADISGAWTATISATNWRDDWAGAAVGSKSVEVSSYAMGQYLTVAF